MKERILLAGLATAVALALVPGAAAGATTQLHCGDVVKRSVKLANDVTECPAEGLVVGAHGITIDLNGHTVDGAPGTTGVVNDGFDRVTLRNGRVQQFELGVRFTGADRFRIDRVSVVTAFRGFSVSDANRGELTRSSASDTMLSCVSLTQAARVQVREFSAQRCDAGVEVRDSSGIEVTRSRFTQSQDPVQLFNSSGNVVTRNTGRAMNAITVGGDDNEIAHNSFQGGGGGEGIRVSGDDNDVVGNTLTEFAWGIFVPSSATDVRLTRNETNRNAFRGIDVQTPSARLTANRAYENGDLGIFAVPGVTDGGGNRAARNGNPAQCVGVRCRP